MKKNFRFALILSAIVLFSIAVNAQTANHYNLSAYKLPDYRYHLLETGFTLAGVNNSHKVFDQKSLYQLFEGDVNVNYNSYLNSRKTQRTQAFRANFNGSSLYKDGGSVVEENSNLYSSFSYGIINKLYFHNKVFLETGVYGRYRYGHIKYSNNRIDTLISINDLTSNEHDVTANIPLGVGIGRIEQIQDYQKAIYIYEDLLKNGRAVAGKSEQEVMELATFISQLKNKRFFDFRIKNIQDLEALDSFLIVNNFKTQNDARYFARLVDNWNFVDNFIRESGTTISFKVTPDYSRYQNRRVYNIDDKHKYLGGSYGIEGGVAFEHFKPLNFYWQSNTAVSAMSGYRYKFEESDTIVPSEYTSSYQTLNLNFVQSIEYYPNTRTRMTGSFNAGYLKLFEEKNIDSEELLRPEGEYIYTGISIMIDYYISQRVRLNATSSVHYNSMDNNTSSAFKSDGFSSAFKVNLAYSIF